MPKATTLGRYLINESLPDGYKLEDNEVMDAKTMQGLFSKLAIERPDEYSKVLSGLTEVSVAGQSEKGGLSPNIRHVKESPIWKKRRQQLQREINNILGNPYATAEEKQKKMTARLAELSPQLTKEIFAEAEQNNNPFAHIVKSGTKGKPANLNNLVGSPLLFSDAKGRQIPIPILHGYGVGLRPSEYWAASYGTRKGVVNEKLGTGKAGFVSKQFVQIAHRGVVTSDDDPETTNDETRGLPVDVDDDDNIGALLSHSVGGFKRNTLITAKVLRSLKKQGVSKMLVRSPLVGGPQDGSLYARDVGVRETGRLPVMGENPGVVAVQALSEPLTQAVLSTKHTAGVIGARGGNSSADFDTINQLIQSPKESINWAAHANSDGMVQKIEKAPQGGHYVFVNNESMYVPPAFEVTVKPGDKVEAGDILSAGLPNPAKIVEHKGVGEGRRYMTQELTKLFRSAGMTAHRRNVELLARGFINHVELDDELDDYVPGDILPYNMLEKYYQPRQDAQTVAGNAALNKYLEKPVLHYTVGTKIRPSVIKTLKEFDLDKDLVVHDNPPPFRPHLVRGMGIAATDPDWISSMQGSGIKSRLLKAVHRGESSNPLGTSFVSGVVGNPDFASQNTTGKIKSPVFQLEEMQKRRIQENIFEE